MISTNNIHNTSDVISDLLAKVKRVLLPLHHIPVGGDSAKLLKEKTFTNFAVMEPPAKDFSTKIFPRLHPRGGGVWDHRLAIGRACAAPYVIVMERSDAWFVVSSKHIRTIGNNSDQSHTVLLIVSCFWCMSKLVSSDSFGWLTFSGNVYQCCQINFLIVHARKFIDLPKKLIN